MWTTPAAQCPLPTARGQRRDWKLHFHSNQLAQMQVQTAHRLTAIQCLIVFSCKQALAWGVKLIKLWSHHAFLFSCCSEVFNLMHFHSNSGAHSNFSCMSCNVSTFHDIFIKLIWLMLSVCPCKSPQNTTKFCFCRFHSVLRSSGAFTDSCYTRWIHRVAPQATK